MFTLHSSGCVILPKFLITTEIFEMFPLLEVDNDAESITKSGHNG